MLLLQLTLLVWLPALVLSTAMADVKSTVAAGDSSALAYSPDAAAVSVAYVEAMKTIGVEPELSPSAALVAAAYAKAIAGGALKGVSGDKKGESKVEVKQLSEKDQLIANLKKAIEEDDYVNVFDALEAAEKKGLGEHKVAIEAQGKLALYMKQMETFEVLDKTVTSRNPKEIELALNLAEEYFLEKTVECRKIQTVRDTMLQMFKDLGFACFVDHTSVDEQLKKMAAYGIDMKTDACVQAVERRGVLFKQSQLVDRLKVATVQAIDTLRAIQRKQRYGGGAASPRDGKSPSSGGDVKRGHNRSSSVPSVDSKGEPASPRVDDIDTLLTDSTASLDKLLKEAKEMAINATEPALEAAKIKLAELQMERRLMDAARGGSLKEADEDADEKNKKKAPKRAPGQEGEVKIDPYNPNGGKLPTLEPEVYAIPKLALHNFSRLRTPEDFARGVVFNKKRYQVGMLIWQSDKLERSVLKPADEKKEAVYNTTAQKIFSNIQIFMGEKSHDKLTPTESVATELMKMGYKSEELRDEIYVQVLKQVTCHPKLNSAILGWQLLGLVCEAFPPSKELAPHVFHVMYPNTKPDVPVCAYAKYCMFTLWNTVNEPLKPITDFTLEHVRQIKRRKMVPGRVRIYFLDGSELDLQVDPHTRVCDSLRTIYDSIKLKDRAGFGIFSVGTAEDTAGVEGREIWVPLNSCLLDYDPQPRPSVSPVLYKAQSARLVFKRRLYQDLTSPDQLAQKLLYYQTLVSICDEGLPCTEKQMHRFLALHRVIDQKLQSQPIANANMLTAVAVKNILPHFVESWSEKKKEKYLEKISQQKAAVSNLKITWEVLINEVREWPLFGCSYFTCKVAALAPGTAGAPPAGSDDAKNKKVEEAPKGVMMGISSQGVFLVHGKEKKLHEDYPFFRIQGFAIEPNNEHIVLTVRDKTAARKSHVHRFKTLEAEEVFALMTTIQEDINSKTEGGKVSSEKRSASPSTLTLTDSNKRIKPEINNNLTTNSMAQQKTDDKMPDIKTLSKSEIEAKFASLKPLFYRPAGMAPPIFEPGWGVLNTITRDTRILVVGAGGLGCELLKDLALSGFQDITVIDMDTIDVTNLNRQFLFRKKDVGGYKAKVAAEFIMRRCAGVKVVYKTKRLQEFGRSFYQSFHIVIAGLDNVEARSWLNNQLCDLVRYDESGEVDWDTVVPMIDGGTTGFMGQTRLFIPRVTSCFECQVNTLQAGDHVHAHLCTIADVPRIPEHCVQYALILLFPRLLEFTSPENYKMAEKPANWDAENKDGKEWEPPSSVKLDKDNAAHMTWIFRRAEERAEKYKIKGVTYTLTQQVVKNIIPAIASTNALISAACVTEALKYRTFSSWRLNNYMMYMGDVATNSETFVHARLPDCKSCAKPLLVTLDNPDTATVAQLVEIIKKDGKVDQPNVVTVAAEPLFNGKSGLSAEKQAHEAEKAKKKLKADLNLQHNDQVIVYSPGQRDLKVIIRYKGSFPEPPAE